MAGSPVIQCVGPSCHLADRKAEIQRAVNCYPKRLDGDNWKMESTPGEVTITNLGGTVRGSHVHEVENRWFVVAGPTLYEYTAPGVFTSRGTIGGSGFVGMAHNRTQLCIVNGPSGYIFSLASNVLTTISAPGWRGSDDVHELDGYFIFAGPETDQFYLSAIDDGASLDALDFSSADSSPDNIVTHRVSHRQAWFFGSMSTEIWINSGGLDFPFVRYQSYTLDVGVVGKRAAINAAETLFWIGKTERGSGIVYMASGNQPQRVSTSAVEEALKASTDISQATMWAYQVEGAEFVAINAPGMETTWVFDAASQQWHERGEWSDGWRPLKSRLVTAVNGEHYAGTESGDIVRLDSDANTLSGRHLVRERTWPHLKQPSAEPVTYVCLEMQMKTGSGGNVTLEISNDGGFTFGPPLVRSLGAIGRWMQRVRWLGLGSAINRVFRIRCSDDVPFAIHSATVDTQ